MPLRHFETKEDYLKWQAYKHIHHLETNDKYPYVQVAGHLIKVKH